jgi:hypothetical protein
MLDLKPYHDAVLAADAEVQRVANDIDVLFQGETDESKTQALALRPALDEAQSKADEAMKLYESLKKSAQPSNLADFVPASQTPIDPETPQEPLGTLKLNEFQAMTPAARLKFAKGGGKVED